MSEIKTRKEILFLYEVIDSNPNGDPLEGNKVRIDSETQQAIVTDVRLKRTVRDYLISQGKDVFVRPVYEGTKLLTKKNVLDRDLGKNVNEDAVLQKYIDLRLFGATIAEKDARITFIGPIQFRFGRTLHPVEPQFYKGTTVFPSKEKKLVGGKEEDVEQGTFTDIHKIPYGLISFYGVVNENAAKETKLTEDDVNLLYEGLWNGTKNLVTRSKFSHNPKLLLVIDYKEPNFFIGDIDRLISPNCEKPPRKFSEIGINFDSLLDEVDNVKEKIKKLGVQTTGGKKDITSNFKEELQKILNTLS